MTDDMYKTLKIPFKHIVKEKYKDQIYSIITDICSRTNIIVRLAYQLLKVYVINEFIANNYEVVIDKQLLRNIFTNVSTAKKIAYVSDITDHGDIFDNIHLPSRDGLAIILSYETETMMTCINNNIKEHFYKRFNKYINIMFKYSEKRENIEKLKIDKAKKDKKIRELGETLFHIKNKILNKNYDVEDNINSEFIKEQQGILFGHIDKKVKNFIYDVNRHPQNYLYTNYVILKKYEELNGNMKDNEKKVKMFSLLPERKSLILKHITLDTMAIIQNFKDVLKENKDDLEIKNVEELRKNFIDKREKIWGYLFKIKEKKKYMFNYLIRTDGMSTSIQYSKDNKKYRFNKKEIKNNKKEIKENKKVKYIEEVCKDENQFKLLCQKRAVCIDPNKGDLLYCGTYKKGKELTTYRYTQKQRKHETKTKKQTKVIKKVMTNEIKKLENEKAEINGNTMDIKKIKKNIKKKEEINEKMGKHYEKDIYRKLRLRRYIDLQRSESNMVNKFKEKMGNKEDVIVIIGDYSQTAGIVKSKESTITKKIVHMFKKNKYDTYIINEHNTSKICNKCEKELEKFKKIKLRIKKGDKEIEKEVMCHGLLRCKSLKCKAIHNRDTNAVKNMLKIVDHLKEHKKRPQIYNK